MRAPISRAADRWPRAASGTSWAASGPRAGSARGDTVPQCPGCTTKTIWSTDVPAPTADLAVQHRFSLPRPREVHHRLLAPKHRAEYALRRAQRPRPSLACALDRAMQAPKAESLPAGALEKIRLIPGNDKCMDCGTRRVVPPSLTTPAQAPTSRTGATCSTGRCTARAPRPKQPTAGGDARARRHPVRGPAPVARRQDVVH